MTQDHPRYVAVPAVPGAEIACTLAGRAVEKRMSEWRSVAARASSREPIEGGLRLAFDEIDARALADLAIREHECCAFLSFAVGIGAGGTTLEVTGPPAARELIASLADPTVAIR